MKKSFLVLLMILFLVSSIQAVQANKFSMTFKKTLQVSYCAMNWIDLGMTYRALKNDSIGESNSFARYLLDRPALAVVFTAASQAAWWFFVDGLYKRNKTLAWIFMGVSVAFRGYILIHNLSVLREARR